MDRNLQAASYLELLSPHGLAQADNLAFKSQLLRIAFDFSLDSLAQVDRMLLELRGSLTMDYQAFMQKQPAVNFVVALNFYIGSTVARAGPFALKWIDHAQASRSMPGLPPQLETDLACVIGNGIYFPAGVVTEMLFDPDQDRTCVSFARQVTTRLEAEGQRMPGPVPRPVAGTAAGPLPSGWADALDGAGSLGRWGLAELASGAQLRPISMLPGPAGRTIVDFSTFGHDNLQDAGDDGMRRLAANPEHAPWQALYYDGFLNLPTGRRDALIVELRVYAAPPPRSSRTFLGGLLKGKPAEAPVSTTLSLTAALSYRPASDAQGFAHFSPRLVDCSCKGAELPTVLDQFYRGIFSAKHFQWDDRFAGD